MCFNNVRILHGRTSWKVVADSGKERHLEGGYIDWDGMRSCRRVLQRKYKEGTPLGAFM